MKFRKKTECTVKNTSFTLFLYPLYPLWSDWLSLFSQSVFLPLSFLLYSLLFYPILTLFLLISLSISSLLSLLSLHSFYVYFLLSALFLLSAFFTKHNYTLSFTFSLLNFPSLCSLSLSIFSVSSLPSLTLLSLSSSPLSRSLSPPFLSLSLPHYHRLYILVLYIKGLWLMLHYRTALPFEILQITCVHIWPYQSMISALNARRCYRLSEFLAS